MGGRVFKQRSVDPGAEALAWLPDYVAEGLEILAIGLNPSIPAAKQGFAFANPRNRFWPALARSQLVGEPLDPGPGAQKHLFRSHRIGFTDVVRRPTRGGAELRAADYREWAPELADKIARYRPRIAWFLGKQPYRQFLRYALGRKDEVLPWGEQAHPVGQSVVFVTPNPSPANAAYSLQDIVDWINALARLRARLRAEAGLPTRRSR